jgi:hypothetical protein
MEHKNLNTEETANSDLGAGSGSLLDRAIELFDMLSDEERIIVMDGYCKGCGRKQDGGICSCVDF